MSNGKGNNRESGPADGQGRQSDRAERIRMAGQRALDRFRQTLPPIKVPEHLQDIPGQRLFLDSENS
jgi:hypothetical protein